ncbi:hypothetical protein I3842_05G048000 [Carya illinoinensis]|uniref:Uncharacterized protein n=1 Tax=Carya illinoinensis TaxID=32201 RepID=A0A922EZ80_CARIL|nr:hypothetical protein I3842_05G048000 [Carya illinoinensis]
MNHPSAQGAEKAAGRPGQPHEDRCLPLRNSPTPPQGRSQYPCQKRRHGEEEERVQSRYQLAKGYFPQRWCLASFLGKFGVNQPRHLLQPGVEGHSLLHLPLHSKVRCLVFPCGHLWAKQWPSQHGQRWKEGVSKLPQR